MKPILYSFRRCPYAMRARLAIASAGVDVELREIILRDKPQHMLEASPKGTVPVLLVDNKVIDESRDIMDWALAINDPEEWSHMPSEGEEWIRTIEGPFKSALDRYKYASRYQDIDASEQRDLAADILHQIEPKLEKNIWLFGPKPSLADMATITFIRQYAMVDKAWFDAQEWPNLKRWLEDFMKSERFVAIMQKYELWNQTQKSYSFGQTSNSQGPASHAQ